MAITNDLPAGEDLESMVAAGFLAIGFRWNPSDINTLADAFGQAAVTAACTGYAIGCEVKPDAE